MFKGTLKYLCAASIGLVVSLVVSGALRPAYISVFIESIVNAMIYFGILLIMDKELKNIIFKLIKKK